MASTGINKVILVGNLGADPEVKHLESGVSVARLRIATTESYKDRNGNRVEHTEWHTVTLWRGLADVAEKYVKKGQTVYIEGRIRTRQWNDKDGNQRYSTEIQGDNMTMLGGGRGNNPEAPAQVQTPAAVPANQQQSTVNEAPPQMDNNLPPMDDDLPF